MVVRADHKASTAAGVVGEYLLYAAAADAGGPVVDDSVAASGVVSVRPWTYAEVTEHRQSAANRDGSSHIYTPCTE